MDILFRVVAELYVLVLQCMMFVFVYNRWEEFVPKRPATFAAFATLSILGMLAIVCVIGRGVWIWIGG